MTTTHRLDSNDVSSGWSKAHEPKLSVSSGDQVEVSAPDCSNGQLDEQSTLTEFSAMDLEQLDPISGPIFVEGAEPGDVLKVELSSIVPASYGWSAVYEGTGLLQEEFPDEWFHMWDLSNQAYAELVPGIRVPLEPMVGIVGCTPDAVDVLPSVPPHRCGGNMDMRFARAGTTLYLPVEVEGALFGIGDPHAAQGDGEVGGAGIETPAQLAFTLSVLKGVDLRFPAFETAAGLERAGSSRAGYYGTTGVGPDLYEAAQDALRGMIQILTSRYDLEPIQAYMLCSVAGDLRISEVVNFGTHVVSCVLPKDLFVDSVDL